MSDRFRFLLLLLAIGIAVFFLYPTVNWYFLLGDADKNITQLNRAGVQSRVDTKVEFATSELAQIAVEDQKTPLPDGYKFLNKAAAKRYREIDKNIPEMWSVGETLAAFSSESDFDRSLRVYYHDEIDTVKQIKSRIILLGLDLSGGVQVLLEPDIDKLREKLGRNPNDLEIDEALDLAIEIITSRIDRFGITEPLIRRREDNTVEISLPGENDPERVEAFLVGKGKLNFHIVDNDATNQLFFHEQTNPDFDAEEDEPPAFIPAGTRIVPYITRDEFGTEEFVNNIVIHNNTNELGLSGEFIQDATYIRDPLTNRPVVNFGLTLDGSNRFSTLTRDNVGGSLAIVVDDQARAYAAIREEIPSGQVQISGFDELAARNIARVLRTASLPIDFLILSRQSVGSLLGEEAVQGGLRAILLGFVLVVLFIFAYYKGAGLLANFMLALNLFLLVSILSVFNLTLTLTSIAGIILTVGMSVDANVIIFERIKEEYRAGKSAAVSVSTGFKKAFWTVMDANVTTFIAALFLSQFGSGPIQGFAVTLSVGIATSMFTALFVSRLFFTFFTETLRRTKLSISWSRRGGRG